MNCLHVLYHGLKSVLDYYIYCENIYMFCNGIRSSPDLCVNYLSQNIELTDLGNLVLLLDWIGLTPLKVVVHIQVPSAGGPFFVEFHEQGTK